VGPERRSALEEDEEMTSDIESDGLNTWLPPDRVVCSRTPVLDGAAQDT
jgi:hypothetical protein